MADLDPTLKSVAVAQFIDHVYLVYYGVKPGDPTFNGASWHWWFVYIMAGAQSCATLEQTAAHDTGKG